MSRKTFGCVLQRNGCQHLKRWRRWSSQHIHRSDTEELRVWAEMKCFGREDYSCHLEDEWVEWSRKIRTWFWSIKVNWSSKFKSLEKIFSCFLLLLLYTDCPTVSNRNGRRQNLRKKVFWKKIHTCSLRRILFSILFQSWLLSYRRLAWRRSACAADFYPIPIKTKKNFFLLLKTFRPTKSIKVRKLTQILPVFVLFFSFKQEICFHLTWRLFWASASKILFI